MQRMPVVFIGHGSPMNAVEDNGFTRNWEKIAAQIPRPEAILALSAHWFTSGTRISDDEHPKMIYDMYGFPKELYEVNYPAKGSPEFAHVTKSLISKPVEIDNSWGYDHGTWSVLKKMYPKADIPVFQMSIDKTASAEEHFQMGKELRALRDKGVLILASGNVVHNLSLVNFSMEGGYEWATEFDRYIKEKIVRREFSDVLQYKNAGKCAEYAFYSPDHFYPLLPILGASDEEDTLRVLNDECMFGALSMTCYLFE